MATVLLRAPESPDDCRNFSQRLQWAMAHRRVSVSMLADRLGISQTAVYNVFRGDTRTLSAENSTRAAKALGLDSDWLAAGDGDWERRSVVRMKDVGVSGERDGATMLLDELRAMVGRADLGRDAREWLGRQLQAMLSADPLVASMAQRAAADYLQERLQETRVQESHVQETAGDDALQDHQEHDLQMVQDGWARQRVA